MQTFITAQVFNPDLSGKAIRIRGVDTEGKEYNRIFLVKEVTGEHITVVNCQGELIEDIHMENFTYDDKEALKISVLEELK